MRKLYKIAKMPVKMFALLMLVCSVLGFTDAGTVVGNNIDLPVKAIAQGTVLYTGYGIGNAWDWTTDTRGLDALYVALGVLGTIYATRKWNTSKWSKKVKVASQPGESASKDHPKDEALYDGEQKLSTYGETLLTASVAAMKGHGDLSRGDYRNIARAMYQRRGKLATF